MAQDWRQKLAEQFSKLETTAARSQKLDPHVEIKGVIGSDGQERLIHHIVEPQPCPDCGLLTDGRHSKDRCILELKAALRYAQGSIQVIRHG